MSDVRIPPPVKTHHHIDQAISIRGLWSRYKE